MSELDPSVVHGWMDTYGARLQAVASAFADGPTEAEDILQRTWVTAWRKGGELPPDSQIGAWLHQITLNIGRTLYRKRAGRRRLLERWRPTRAAAEPPPTIDEELFRIGLWRAVAELPELQRKVILLRVVEDMSVAEAARALSRAEGTVKASLHRALATLRRQLGPIPRTDSWREAS